MAYPTGLNWQMTGAIGYQPITTTSTTQNHPIGTRVKAIEPTYGEGEFIYLKGVASTVAGSVVVYDIKGNTTVLLLDDTGFGQTAVAMSANVAGPNYGWYCIQGVVPVSSGSNTVAAGAVAYMTGTGGQIDDAIVAGDEIIGMTTVSASSANFTYCQLSYPFTSQNDG